MHYLSYRAKLGATNLHPFGRQATSWLLSALDLHSEHRVLEIGCGTGETMLRVAREHGALVDGVDVLPEMLDAARLRLALVGLSRRARLYQVRPGDGLPFSADTYDRAYSESVLGFQNPASAMRMLTEIRRVLKPGGVYVANEAIWKDGVTEAQTTQIHRAEIRDFGLGQASEQAWSLNDWLAAMRNAGFEVASATKLDDLRSRATQLRRRTAPSLVVSDMLTRLYRLKGVLNPAVLARRARYRRLLLAHRAEGQLIEGTLFVLRKPIVAA